MTDLDTAKAHLSGHSLCLCKDGAWFTDDGRGISPMLRLIGENRGLRGYAAADIIVGKAAAMLFVKAGIAAVYGLEAHGIPFAFGTLTENIINRKGDGVCPMEQAVAALDDAEAGCAVLRDKLNSLKNKA